MQGIDYAVIPDVFLKKLVCFLLDKHTGNVNINVNEGRIEQYDFTDCYRIKRKQMDG